MNTDATLAIIVFLLIAYWSIGSYSKYKTNKIEQETKIKIAEIKSKSDMHYANTMKNLTEALKEVNKNHE